MSTFILDQAITKVVRHIGRSRPRSLHYQPTIKRAASSKHPNGFVPPTAEDLSELRERVQEFTRREIPEDVAAKTDKDNVIGLSYAAHSQLCINQLCLHGTDDQKTRLLPDLVSGEKIGALAMSEHSAGSDVVSMKTKATVVEGGHMLNGSKMWITNGPDANYIIVYAKTEPEKASKGITAFIVDSASKGFSCARKLDKLGMRGSNTGELVFEDVFVPRENILGQVNSGVKILMEGIMSAALDLVLPYTHTRTQFGIPIAHNQLIQAKLADMYTKFRASFSYTYSVAQALDMAHATPRDRANTQDCAGAILYAAERSTECALDAIQLMGGMGYVNEVPAGRLLRDAKLYEIGAGTSE
ncbi:MAG: hypothetical protein Q9164_000488, partial [Protoblastenia rupestris]